MSILTNSNIPTTKSFGTRLFYVLVFTPLIIVIEWLMAFNWGLYSYMVFAARLDVDYSSSIVKYLYHYFDTLGVGLIFSTMTVLHVIGIIYKKLWLRILPLIIDVAIILMYAGSLFVYRPMAIGGVTVSTLAIIIIFGIIKALNVKYTVYTLRDRGDKQ